jgi:HlyD family secretion protein
MQVQANVDEADIGLVRMLQPVDFTVDAYPNEIFKGSVRQIRLQPVVTSNVVTYTVIVNAPNPEKKLMPGMTANITVLVQKVDSVLVIPGKALRFTPEAAYLTEYFKKNPPPNRNQQDGGTGQAAGTQRQRNSGEGGQGGPGQGGPGQGGPGQGGAGQGGAGQGGAGQYQTGSQQGKKPVIVWIKSGDLIHRTRITTGAIDGTNAEVKTGLKEGDEVILSMGLASKATTTAAATTTSPFMPTRPGGRGR